VRRVRQLLQTVHVGRGYVGAQSPQRHGAVHRARVNVHKSKFARDAPRERAFAGAGWAVDRNRDSFAQIIMKAHA